MQKPNKAPDPPFPIKSATLADLFGSMLLEMERNGIRNVSRLTFFVSARGHDEVSMRVVSILPSGGVGYQVSRTIDMNYLRKGVSICD